MRRASLQSFFLLLFVLTLAGTPLFAQEIQIRGVVSAAGQPLPLARVSLLDQKQQILTKSGGYFEFSNLPLRKYKIEVSHVGFQRVVFNLMPTLLNSDTMRISLLPTPPILEEVVVTGTMKEVAKSASPVPIDVIHAKFFKANPSCSVFDALQNVNGVRPQLNCNICNTGDIHVNGLEGPYTMVLIDGMPIVSGLSSVYGLSGIPQSLIDRVEIMKGPASTLYGSEAVGGLLNIITKTAATSPSFSLDVFRTSWRETNLDMATKINFSKKACSYLGTNMYNYSHPKDMNRDHFTDVAIQKRISLFNKWEFSRKGNRILTVAGRAVVEDRWGGEMNWNKTFRGGDSVYGESILTHRWELLSNYQLPTKEKLFFRSSLTYHNQNSAYGKLSFLATQIIGFGQLTWEKKWRGSDVLLGACYRYTYYDDNTVATAASSFKNQPSLTRLPGVFVQQEIKFNKNKVLLWGMRYDYNSLHGSIVSPRINYKWNSADNSHIIRLGIGNGYRVASVFTEDHAALTGARDVLFLSTLKPERSWNAQINYQKKISLRGFQHLGLDLAAFFTHFSNKIVADYITDPNKIYFDNLHGYAISKGFTGNVDFALRNAFKCIAGITWLDTYSIERNKKIRPLFTEKLTGTWTISYTWNRTRLVFDYTGNVYSPIKLPLLSVLDPRKAYSPWWSIQNLQVTKKIKNSWEIYTGVKNLLNWTPNNHNPFIIARANDPFDKEVQFDTHGQAIPTTNNPYGLTFDPSYVFGPNQGIRFFWGVRYQLK